MSFERRIIFQSAFDKRDPDPSKNYGVHGVEFAFHLIGEEGGVQFTVFTHWMLPHVQKETDARTLKKAAQGLLDDIDLRCFYHPQPADLSYHSKRPLYKDQEPSGANYYEWRDPTPEEVAAGLTCKIPEPIPQTNLTRCEITGGVCYTDGSTLNAEPIFEILLREGSVGVWRALEEYYESTFHGKDEQNAEEKTQ